MSSRPPPCACSPRSSAAACRNAARALTLDYAPGDSPDMPAPVATFVRPCRCSCHDAGAYTDDDPTEPGSYPDGCEQ
jgi:hypothetical protein